MINGRQLFILLIIQKEVATSSKKGSWCWFSDIQVDFHEGRSLLSRRLKHSFIGRCRHHIGVWIMWSQGRYGDFGFKNNKILEQGNCPTWLSLHSPNSNKSWPTLNSPSSLLYHTIPHVIGCSLPSVCLFPFVLVFLPQTYSNFLRALPLHRQSHGCHKLLFKPRGSASHPLQWVCPCHLHLQHCPQTLCSHS